MNEPQLTNISYLPDRRRFNDQNCPLHTCRRCGSDDVWVFGRQADPRVAGSAVCRRCQFVLPFGCPDKFFMLDRAELSPLPDDEHRHMGSFTNCYDPKCPWTPQSESRTNQREVHRHTPQP